MNASSGSIAKIVGVTEDPRFSSATLQQTLYASSDRKEAQREAQRHTKQIPNAEAQIPIGFNGKD